MNKIDDGGPAFPHQDWDPAIHSQRREHGMSLRDWFAGQALVGLMASETEKFCYKPGEGAERAFAFADAMIAARKQPTEEQQ